MKIREYSEIVKHQHYVPKCYFKYFSTKSRKTKRSNRLTNNVYVLKGKRKTREKLEDICCEDYLYEYFNEFKNIDEATYNSLSDELKGYINVVELNLGKIEKYYPNILSKIYSKIESLKVINYNKFIDIRNILNKKELKNLVLFFMVLSYRAPDIVNKIDEYSLYADMSLPDKNRMIIELTKYRNELDLGVLTEEGKKDFYRMLGLHSLFGEIREIRKELIVPYKLEEIIKVMIYTHDIGVYKLKDEIKTSDNPVIKINNVTCETYIDVITTIKESDIYIPITPHTCLCFLKDSKSSRLLSSDEIEKGLKVQSKYLISKIKERSSK